METPANQLLCRIVVRERLTASAVFYYALSDLFPQMPMSNIGWKSDEMFVNAIDWISWLLQVLDRKRTPVADSRYHGARECGVWTVCAGHLMSSINWTSTHTNTLTYIRISMALVCIRKFRLFQGNGIKYEFQVENFEQVSKGDILHYIFPWNVNMVYVWVSFSLTLSECVCVSIERTLSTCPQECSEIRNATIRCQDVHPVINFILFIYFTAFYQHIPSNPYNYICLFLCICICV